MNDVIKVKMKEVLTLLYENLKIIILSLILIVLVLLTVILLGFTVKDDVRRAPVISEVSGEGIISRNDKLHPANTKMRLSSGDIIKTDENGYVRIRIDDDKSLLLDNDSAIQIYFTDIAGKGTIEVNISRGSVICELDSALKKNANFKIKTPNTVIETQDAVLRIAFEAADKFMGYNDVYITDIQNFSGSADIQLYDMNAQPKEDKMLLVERACAKMFSCLDDSKYVFLNLDTDIFSLPEPVLSELMRINVNNKKIAYGSEEINAAFKAVQLMNVNAAANGGVPTETSVSEFISIATTPLFADELPYTMPSVADIPPIAITEALPKPSPGLESRVYTTFPGDKWWIPSDVPNVQTEPTTTQAPFNDSFDNYIIAE